MENNPLHPLIVPLHGTSTHHHWGVSGPESLAARLHSLNKAIAISTTKPCSEFLISSSDAAPAILVTTPTVTLRDHVQAQVIEVDAAIVPFYSRLHEQGLPYSLRIISVASPTGLCVHPSPENASLSSASPRVTESSDRRPIMLVALRPSRLLLTFRSAKAVVADLLRVPEFADAVGRPNTDHFVHVVKTATPRHSHLQHVVTCLANAAESVVTDCLARAATRLARMPTEAVTDADRDFLALQSAFPNDPMCFAVYLLNRVEMTSGQAVFIAPGEPYCIFEGDFVLASTTSDTVFFGGLVPRNDTRSLFLESLSYSDTPVSLSTGDRFSDYGVSYIPPVEEFQLLEFKLPAGTSQQMARTLAPSIIMVLGGEGTIAVDDKEYLLPLRPGCVFYLTPRTHFTVTTRDIGAGPLHVFQIGVNESAAPSSGSSCTVM